MLFLTIIAFILILGILIFVHEFGHFISAKICGVKVEEFGFGFPPKIFGVKRGETEYSLNWIPIGGFVKLLGEEEANKSTKSFNTQSIPKRVFIIIAGVLMNLVFAVFILSIGFMIGMSPIVSDAGRYGGNQETEIIIAGVTENSPAKSTGLGQGDIITGYKSIEDFQNFTKSNIGKDVSINIKKDGNFKDINITLSSDEKAPLGVALVQATKVKLPFFQAIKAGFIETGLTVSAIFKFLYGFFRDLFSGQKVAEQVSGPIGIFTITKQAVKLGFTYVLQFMALLSVNLAIMNILPFPALDGGKIIFLVGEGIRGKRFIKMEHENLIHWIGFTILIALIILITYNDIVRLIRG